MRAHNTTNYSTMLYLSLKHTVLVKHIFKFTSMGSIRCYFLFLLQMPTTPTGWLATSEHFEKVWNFPHCLGAMDGKHVVLQAPVCSGSNFYNYKSTFSIVLFALVDAKYNFLFVDVGFQGRISDEGVFRNCKLCEKMEKDFLGFPPPAPLTGRKKPVPYFFVADEAFPLQENIMKVFSGVYPKGSIERTFNYRLCRTHRVVENVFGITYSVFRVLRKPMLLQPEKAKLIVMTIAHLHNFLRRSTHSADIYTPPGTFDHEVDGKLVEGSWRNTDSGNRSTLFPIRNIPRRSSAYGKEVRDEIAQYLQNEGRTLWQDSYS